MSDALMIANEFGLDPGVVGAWLHRLAIALAADLDAGVDEVVRRFGEDSRAFGARYHDGASGYTGFREGLRDAIGHEAYAMIRQAAPPGEDPRRVAYRLSGRKG
jgi:hypothetical protein